MAKEKFKRGTQEFSEHAIPVDISSLDDNKRTIEVHVSVYTMYDGDTEHTEYERFAITMNEEQSDDEIMNIISGVISTFGYKDFFFKYQKVLQCYPLGGMSR